MTDYLTPYYELSPMFFGAFVCALFLTPLIGHLARRCNVYDLPSLQRKRTDKSISTRIHTKKKLRWGGLAVLIPFIILSLIFTQSQEIRSLLLGLGVLMISGIIDDKWELKARSQLFMQFLASLIVVMGGIKLLGIDLAFIELNFNLSSTNIDLGLFVYNFIFPADIVTILWIMLIINAINWMYGIDSVGEMITFISGVTLMMLAIRAGNLDIAIISALLSGGVLGFLPYNFPPSKIFSGTTGTTSYGFLLAVLAIISGAKFTTAVMLLSLPLVDMIWVVFYRLKNIKDVPLLKRPFVGGSVHLHHRLMALGLNNIQTLLIETSMISLISIVAFYLGGFSTNFLLIVILIASLVIIFAVINIVGRIKSRKKKIGTPEPPSMVDNGPTPEEKYAY